MNKEQAIIMVRNKWKDMGAEEKEVWNGMAKREKKQEKYSSKPYVYGQITLYLC